MSWRVGLSVAIVVAVTVAAVAVATMSVGGPGDAERVRAALRLSANCAPTVSRPSRAAIVKRWSPSAVQSADIACGSPGLGVAYAHFSDADSLNRAVLGGQPAQPYCVFGASIMIDGLVGVDSTVFTDMCQSLGGTPVSNAP